MTKPSLLPCHKHLLDTASQYRTDWTRTQFLPRKYRPVARLPVALILQEKHFHENLLRYRWKPRFWKLLRRNIIFAKIFNLIIISWPKISTLETPGVEPVCADKQIE